MIVHFSGMYNEMKNRRMKKIEEIKEIWKDIHIDGFEGLYQASNLGNIKTLQRTIWTTAGGNGHWMTYPEKIMKPALTGTYIKYKYVVFANNKYRRKYLVHRLVYETFKGKIPEGYTIDHIDADSMNNNIDNLQCVTKQQNNSKANNYGKKNTKKSYLVTDTETGEEKIFATAVEASKYLGVSPAHIRTTARGKSTTNLIGSRYKVETISKIA